MAKTPAPISSAEFLVEIKLAIPPVGWKETFNPTARSCRAQPSTSKGCLLHGGDFWSKSCRPSWSEARTNVETRQFFVSWPYRGGPFSLSFLRYLSASRDHQKREEPVAVAVLHTDQQDLGRCVQLTGSANCGEERLELIIIFLDARFPSAASPWILFKCNPRSRCVCNCQTRKCLGAQKFHSFFPPSQLTVVGSIFVFLFFFKLNSNFHWLDFKFWSWSSDLSRAGQFQDWNYVQDFIGCRMKSPTLIQINL